MAPLKVLTLNLRIEGIKPSGDGDAHAGVIKASLDNGLIGSLDYAHDGFVEYVQVDSAYRRRGVATSMLAFLMQMVTPQFCTEGNTPEGAAWIAAMQRKEWQ